MKLRNIWIGINAIFIFLFSIPRLLIVKATKNEKLAFNFMSKTVNKLIKRANIDLEVVGDELFDTDENFLLIANHEGFFDILYIMKCMKRRPVGFVAKDSLGKIPVFSSWMKIYNCIFIDRNDLKQQVKAIKITSNLVKDGNNMCVMPQGTRSQERTEFKAGSFKIATKSKATIVPITIINSSGAFEDRCTNKKQKAKIIIHKPLYYDQYKDLKTSQLAEKVENIVYDSKVIN